LITVAGSLARAVAPRGHADTGSINVARARPGRRKQGTHADDIDPRIVFERHVDATALVKQPVDLVVWPENVVHVEGPVSDTDEGVELAELARTLGATLSVGVIEGAGDDHFHNSQIAYDADGNLVARYEKVRRVPFGEWMPMRGLLEAIGAPTNLARRDPRHGTPGARHACGRLGVVIRGGLRRPRPRCDRPRRPVLLNPRTGVVRGRCCRRSKSRRRGCAPRPAGGSRRSRRRVQRSSTITGT
jgi:apolipoprotein N-acyltransferase